MVNRVMLVGRAGHDGSEKVKEMGRSGSILANLSIATSERRKDRDGNYNDHTVWHNCSIFGKQAEYVEKYVKKGDLVYIEGSIDQWKDNDGKYHTQIKVARVQGIPTGGGGGGDRSSGDRGRRDDRRSDRDDDRSGSRDRGRDRDDDRGARRDDRDPPRESRDSGKGRDSGGYSGPPNDDIPF